MRSRAQDCGLSPTQLRSSRLSGPFWAQDMGSEKLTRPGASAPRLREDGEWLAMCSGIWRNRPEPDRPQEACVRFHFSWEVRCSAAAQRVGGRA